MTATRVLQRFIMPLDKDPDVFPLYVDPEPSVLDADPKLVAPTAGASRQPTSTGRKVAVEDVLGRRSVRIREGRQLSFGSYFNGFAASYWRRWTIVDQIRLDVTLTGRGSHVIVYRSMANGRSQKVADAVVAGDDESTVSFDLSLVPFQDGGWYWFDVITGDADAVVTDATWSAEVPEDRATPRTATIGITTMNRPDFCAALLRALGDTDVLAVVDEVLVMEQGTQKVADDAAFPDAEKALQGKLRIIEQANLGGSGGFARAQLETLRADRSAYVLFLDDDIIVEPEAILRTIAFGDLARRPTIVGGHMFSIFNRAEMHSYGEIVERSRFWWQSAPTVQINWDFNARNLRSTRWLHKRIDVDFNPWFLCMIPVEVMRDIGLGLPLFIKWDDSEYGVRAQAAGYPTVSLPGSAVWHVPWTDKNDSLDWQAYFHQRNRFIAALLHSPAPRGGKLISESFQLQVMHLLCMQYSVVEMRHQALLDVLAGPARLHEELGTKLGEVRALRSHWRDADMQSDPEAFPRPLGGGPAFGGEVPSRRRQTQAKITGVARQFRAVRGGPREVPQAVIPAMDAKWYRLAGLDAAVVSMPDGTSAAYYQRNPDEFRSALKRSISVHRQLRREWPQLSARYRSALADITSTTAWAATFGIEENK